MNSKLRITIFGDSIASGKQSYSDYSDILIKNLEKAFIKINKEIEFNVFAIPGEDTGSVNNFV